MANILISLTLIINITSRKLDFRTKATFNVAFFKYLWGIKIALGVNSFVSNGGGISLKNVKFIYAKIPFNFAMPIITASLKTRNAQSKI